VLVPAVADDPRILREWRPGGIVGQVPHHYLMRLTEWWLGEHEFIDTVSVAWPDGQNTVINGPLAASGIYRIKR